MKGYLLLFASAVISFCTMSYQVNSLALVDHHAPPVGRVSIVTGASGYLGRLVVKELIENSYSSSVMTPSQRDEKNDGIMNENDSSHRIICLVRETRIRNEEQYWSKIVAPQNVEVIVRPYDMVSLCFIYRISPHHSNS